MQNIPDPASVSSVHPQSFKTQLKKLSGTTTHRKAFKTGNVLDAVAVNNKGAEVKPQASKAKRFAGEEVQENVSDSVQNDAINNAESVTHSSNSVHIASLSTDELSDKARTYNTSFESQADTIVSQVSIATPVSTSVASATPSFSLAGMGAGLGALALGGSSGGSSGGGAQTTAVTTTPKSDTPLALSGFIAAGPMVNNDGLKVEVFDVNGNRLASTNSVKDGTFTINLKNTYTGILKVVVSDTNGEAINFIDEANGKSKSLGTDLITIFNLLAGEKNLNINVNTLTTEAANKVLTVSNDLTKVTNADISKANLEIATKYGLTDKSSQAAIKPDLLITSKPGLIIDSTGAINQGFNAYGLALAVKSVLDDNPSMTIKDACKSLAENPLYAKSFSGPTDWASAVYKFGASFLDNVLPTGSSTITVANDQPISQTTTITQGQVLRATSSITDNDGIPTSGAGALSYKWQASSDKTNWSDSDIVDATGNTFTTTQAQVGKFIRAVATYTDNFGTTETVESAPTNSIVNIDDATTGALTISGTGNQGQVLTATSTIADIDGIPASGVGALSYKWQSSSESQGSWSDIAGPTASTFTTTQEQVGKYIRAVATYTDNFGATEIVTSVPTTNVIANVNDAPTGILTIPEAVTPDRTGFAAGGFFIPDLAADLKVVNQGQVLTATSTIADIDGIPASGAGALSYKWQASSDKTNWSDSDIVDATGNTFTTTQAQVDKYIRVVATYTDNFGATEIVNSLPSDKAITNANDAPSGALTISGTANQGQVLTATSTIADIDGIPASGVGALSFKWQSSSVSGGGWSDIAGATASTFTTTQAQVGKFIRVVATYTDNFGTAETVESAPTDAITYEYEVDPLLIEGTSTVAPASQTGSTQSFAAGDVNGDGISDWIYAIGGPEAGTTPALMKREMYVMFGDTSGTYVLNTANPDKGFPIQLHSLTGEKSVSPFAGNRVGYLPRIATDFNGDGKGEIIVGTFHENLDNEDVSKNRLLLVDQANRKPDANQALIKLVNFASADADVGYRASDSGDINGDGFSDLIIGNQGRRNVNIIYGNKNIDPVNYNYNEIAPGGVLPANFGFNIIDSKHNLDLEYGWAVSALGDVNGDGYGDMAIANSWSFDPTLQSVEEVFVIFGKPGRSNANIDVNSIRSGADNTQGYVISMDPQLPFLAFNMSFTATKVAGDFNGDGLNDFVFEGHSYDHTAAKFYVVFGKQSTSKIRLDELGTNGFSISFPTSALRDVIYKMPSENDYFADMPRHTAANCGDFNGDGIDDMLISLIFNTRLSDTEKTNHFLSYVVYGKTELGDIDLNDLGNNGFKVFEGTRTLPTRSEFFGNVVPVGDINADGLPDLVFDDYFGTQEGAPTVIFGSSIDQPQPQWKVTHQGFDGSDTLTSSGVNQSETFIAGAGQDTLWGKGGADVMYAGAGNDVFYLNADNINKLSTPMQNNERLARVDGGGGLDTLALDGSDINVDLTAIANTRLQSIEKINLGGNNKLKLSWQDIQNMSAMNLFNDATSGWSGFSSNTIRHHQLLIDGSATDSVDFLTEGGWVKEPTTVQLNNGESIQNYNLYTNTNHATQLLVNTSVGTVI
jgi:hypothetical protein